MNHLWGAIPRKERASLQQICVEHILTAGDILQEGGGVLRHVYFPFSGYVSMLASVKGTPSLEVGMVGREGMLGAQILLGVTSHASQALVQGGGVAMRARIAPFQRELAAAPGLRRCIGRYLHVRMEQLAGIAPCLRFHVIEARLARWLLMSHDRSPGAVFLVKQEFLSYMLGVRRTGVSAAAMSLERQGLIRYSRGTLEVLDRTGLEVAACACYAADCASYEKQLGVPFTVAAPPG